MSTKDKSQAKSSALTNSKTDMEKQKALNDIEDINNLATKSPKKVKPDQENFIKENSHKSRIAESQESTKGSSAVFMIIIFSIYGATILFCFAIIGFGLAPAERREILTLIITSQATLIGSAIGFYLGKNQ